MAAIDTFDWFISTGLSKPDDETKRLIDEQRAYLLSLRNEDERQRSVDEWIREIREFFLQTKSSTRRKTA